MNYIRKEDLDYSKTRVFETPVSLEKYDMYYVTITLKSGQKRIIRVFTDKGTIPNMKTPEYKELCNLHGEDMIRLFVEGRLWGKDGLMAKEGRQDYIYLGSFAINGYIAERFTLQKNGKTAQEDFDDNLLKIKMKVEAQEKPKESKENIDSGKHYAISDIHGMYGSYMEVMNRLNKEDHLYIVGDVIDRGNGGIKIIQDIMKRQENPENNPKITFLLGNHEMMFIQTLIIMQKYKLSKKDIVTVLANCSLKRRIGEINLMISDVKRANRMDIVKEYEQQLNEINENNIKIAFDELIQDKNITDYEIARMENWISYNHGYSTLFDFIDTKEQQPKIYQFLVDSSYVIYPEKIGDKNILFVHAMPPKDKNMIEQIKVTNKGYGIRNLEMEEIAFMLEERDEGTYEQSKRAGFLTICGHTPEIGKIQDEKDKGYVRIDAGCGHGRGYNKGAKLALYCIEDDRVEYFDEKEEYRTPSFGDSR